MQNGQFVSKIKNAKKVRKTIVRPHLKLLCAKNRSKKHLIFEKWEHFENGQNWPRCMGYSPCKMISLGQKLKMPKRCEKRLYYHIQSSVVCKKPLQKTPNIRKTRAFWKWPKLAPMHDAIAHAKLSVCGQKLKMPKGCEKRLCDHVRSCCVPKNRSKKHLIFEKWEHFENGQNWPRCMGYSPCKMVSLGQKLKMLKRCEKRLYYHIKGVVCKKQLQKRPNIRKMRAFWKWPKLATMHGL